MTARRGVALAVVVLLAGCASISPRFCERTERRAIFVGGPLPSDARWIMADVCVGAAQ